MLKLCVILMLVERERGGVGGYLLFSLIECEEFGFLLIYLTGNNFNNLLGL